jgi:tetratricopeptide (TPR) repeat protein
MDTTAYTEEKKEFLSRANEYLKDGLFAEADTLAEERLSRYPGDVDAHIITATCLILMGKLTPAWAILSKLDGLIREWSQVYELLGYIYSKKKLPHEAVKAYEKFLCLNPDSAMRSDIADTIDSLKGGLEGDKATKKKFVAAEKETEEGGRADRKVRETEKTGGVKGTAASFASGFDTIILADLYFQQGHDEMARDVLNRILAKDPRNVEAQRRLERMGSSHDNRWLEVIDELNRWLKNLRGSGLS